MFIYDIVIEADIVRFFDNIQHDLLLEKITDIIGSLPGFAALLDLIGRILSDQAKALGTPGACLVQLSRTVSKSSSRNHWKRYPARNTAGVVISRGGQIDNSVKLSI